MDQVVCSARCKFNTAGQCRRRVAHGEPIVRLDQRGCCTFYRPVMAISEMPQ